ncbi:hypothetical protein [Streptomyces sp. NPDC051016]|uniref:hypothetical protein n=1 Tax=Streptomyces sp. NPDC051016 TaxID=3365638 RepID=UPI0037B7F2B9
MTGIAYYGIQMDVPVNSIGRYKINDRSALEADADGAFLYVLRVYCPQDSALDGDRQAPRLERMPAAV